MKICVQFFYFFRKKEKRKIFYLDYDYGLQSYNELMMKVLWNIKYFDNL